MTAQDLVIELRPDGPGLVVHTTTPGGRRTEAKITVGQDYTLLIEPANGGLPVKIR